ncbi:Prolyl 4-hydroxylase 1 [Cytospora mali]|uniref:Prolyl 4-hydroxylase 1 n=1 Tax=Cytospora mali TaxID=578113 RepID=A0A194WCX2_CYTMA|nr:Prolyl 4-hydroxylase 1 [Valsa mali]
MAKSKVKRKQQSYQLVDGSAAKKLKTEQMTLTVTVTPRSLNTVVPEEDLEITVDTLKALAENPSLIKSKACKDLRTAVFDFRKACTTGFNAADRGLVEARILLAEMRIRGQKPKLGALCRWVRDLDVISGLAEQREGRAQRTAAQAETLQVLDAILRVTGPVDYTRDDDSALDGEGEGPMVVRKAWDLRDDRSRKMVYDSVIDGTLPSSMPASITSRFRIIETTPGPQRNPPNHHPAILHASQDNTIVFSSPPPKTTHHKHPVVPNLHLMRDVLSPEECGQIIGAAEKIGFTPDAPVRAEGEDGENSILAHNFYWIADEAFCNGVWKRVEPFVPARVGGKKVRGLNRRFRVYRYVPGAEYRAHIDGAWPPSGILPDDTYQYDASLPGAKQSSLFTFLIYLNDEFDAGETTFFLPGPREGTMHAYSVKPIQGSVALFPHGETEGSLLHEGTGVRRGDKPSAKYVIRTDVEYDVDPGRD